MENGAIPDAEIRASTELADHRASDARLNQTGSWGSSINDHSQYLDIDVGYEFTIITGIATQGRSDLDQWVTKYKLWIKYYYTTTYYKEPGQNATKVHKSFIYFMPFPSFLVNSPLPISCLA